MPIQGTPGSTTRAVEAGFFTRATQLYGAFLGEPRTFGATLRGKLGFARKPRAGICADAASAAASDADVRGRFGDRSHGDLPGSAASASAGA